MDNPVIHRRLIHGIVDSYGRFLEKYIKNEKVGTS